MTETYEEICARIEDKLETQPAIVQEAFCNGITDAGHITDEERRLLKRAVKSGVLMKIFDFNFPNPKPRYTMNWNDMITLFRAHPDYVNDCKRDEMIVS